jgi:hypothetical protein
LQSISFFGLFHMQPGAPPQDIGHHTAVSRVKVLDDNKGGGKATRQHRQHFPESVQAARGRRQSDDFKQAADGGRRIVLVCDTSSIRLTFCRRCSEPAGALFQVAQIQAADVRN